ncbi:MAG: S8 family serine peptidase [Lachnospiraceae bacterium]|nr:S8 family serine peptidase [Lachnospiraceae bacterium]
MKRVTRKFIALLMCMVMVLSMMTSISASTGKEDSSSGTSGFSWEEADGTLAASITSDEADEVEEDAVDPDTEVRVAIVFEEDSAIEAGYSTAGIASNEEALAYMDELAESQEEILEVIADEVYDGEALDTDYSFTLATNAVTATIAYGEIEAIEAVEGVSAVYVQTQYEVQDDTQTTTAADMISSTSVWAAGYTGAGMKVAIVDTGIDIDHQSFSQQGYLYSLEQLDDDSYTETWLTADQIAEVLPYLNASATYYEATGKTLSVADVYQNAKVPFAYNYVDEDLDITHDNDDQGDHGTHVTGIAAANKYVYIDGEYVEAAEDSDIYTVGVAPDAQVLTMKVFGKNGGAWSEDYVAAIEDAVMLGADAVNLSLGSAAAGLVTCDSEWEQGIFDSLSESDTIVSISAGNNSYWSENSNYGYNLTEDTSISTTSSPSTYENALSVASADNTGATGYAFEAAGVNVVYTETTGYGNEALSTLDTSEDGSGTEYEYVILAPGMTGDYDELWYVDAALKEAGDEDGLAGKIVFIQRGTISFYVKAGNAAAYFGAVATVIYNNTNGSISMDLTGYEAYGVSAPAVSILESEGYEIMANSEENEYTYVTGWYYVTDENGEYVYDEEAGDYAVEYVTEDSVYYTGTMTVSAGLTKVTSDDPTAATMSTFSSWGSTSALTIKPEITAPGGSIWSTYTDGEYGLMSGTSMAAPSVTGMSALVLQHIYDNEALSELVESGEYTARALAQSLLMGTATPLVETDYSGVEYSVRQQGSGLANVLNAVTSTAFLTVEGQDDGKVKAELGDDADREGVYSFTFTVTNFGDETVSYDLDSSVLTADVFEYYGDLYMDTVDVELDSVTSFVLDVTDILIYDLNEDGVVDSLDALLVLQYANDKDTLTEEQLTLADLDGDGDVDTADAYLWLLYIEEGDEITWDATATLTDADTLSVEAGTSASVTVTIELTDEGKDFLDTYYANGGYVEGYVYLNASAGDNEEGAIVAVDQSIPFLAYYGSWAEPSMYERSVLIDDYYDEYYGAYNYNYNYSYYGYYYGGYTNYYTLTSGGSSYYFLSNLYADDYEYIADRNALSSVSGDAIGSAVFTQIRNSADTYILISDAETGEVYYYEDLGAYYAEYYYSSDDAWYYTSNTVTINWAGTDAEGNALTDGTKVLVQVVAVTELTDEDGNYIIGDGSTLDLPLTIDNTAPVGNGVLNEDGDLVVTVSDNNYVAAVQLYDADDNYLISVSPQQTEAGWDVETEINLDEYLMAYEGYDLAEYSEYQGTSIYTVVVVDYAGNETEYRVKLDDSEEYATASDAVVLFVDGEETSSVSVMKNNSTTVTAKVYPLNAEDRSVTWTSADESIATVNVNGVVTGISEGTTTITATSNQTPEVYATCEVEVFSIDIDLNALYWDEDGYVHEAGLNTLDLSTYDEILYLGTTQYMSQTLVGDTLYVATYTSNTLGSQCSDIYTLDLETGDAEYVGYSYWMTDMAYSTEAEWLLGFYGPYLNIVDPVSGEYLGYFNLYYYGFYDYMVGLTYAYTVEDYYDADWDETYDIEVFYAISEYGDVYEFYFYYGGFWGWSDCLGNIGVDSNWYFDSACYDAESGYLFFSSYDGNNNQYLYAITFDEEGYVDSCVTVGGFNAGVWPVAGLFQTDASEAEAADGNAVNETAHRVEISLSLDALETITK